MGDDAGEHLAQQQHPHRVGEGGGRAGPIVAVEQVAGGPPVLPLGPLAGGQPDRGGEQDALLDGGEPAGEVVLDHRSSVT